MSKIHIVNADSSECQFSADLILTDPPFDMSAKKLASILKNQDVKHIILLTTMRQFIEVFPLLGLKLAFDFVFDSVAPKKSISAMQPNYTHITGVYLHADGEKSLFNRKLRQRSDVFEGNGYWPTIFHAPKELSREHGHTKNLDSVTDLLGSFNVKTVLDLFAGTGTTALAAYELGLDCIAVEKNSQHCDYMHKTFKFLRG